MTHKMVTVRYDLPAADAADYQEKQALTDIFLGVASQHANAAISVTAKRFEFAVDRATFQSMIENNVFPTPIADAFHKADAIMSEADAERSGFLARLVDSFRYQEAIRQGRPPLSAPQYAADMKRVNVIVERYGLASKPKPE